MRVALVHDYLLQYGGAERVLESFCEIFPNAPIFTIAHNPQMTSNFFKNHKIHTSCLQKFPFIKSNHRLFPLLMPLVIEQFDFSAYDLVISSSHSYAKSIITPPHVKHITYCHTPMRYVWDDCHRHLKEFHYNALIKPFIPLGLNYLRLWDSASSDRPDYYIANSHFVAQKIKKYYRQDAEVIYPPIGIDNFHIQPDIQNYFLIVGRALPYKKFDIAVKAFNKLKLPLKIIGKGPEIKYLKKIANNNIEFLGHLDDTTVSKYYAQCQAFIMSAEEDFGITPLEAMASGRPVIAYRGGGALETIIDGKTGIFFNQQTPKSLINAIKQFQSTTFDSLAIRQHTEKFHKSIFQHNIKQYIAQKINT